MRVAQVQRIGQAMCHQGVEVLMGSGRGADRRAEQASKASAETSFAEFVRVNTAALVRTAYLLTGSAHGAEELVQDTLVRLYPQWWRVEGADVPLAYVRRSLSNGFINQRRRASSTDIITDTVPDRPRERSDEDDLVDRDEVWALLRTVGHRQRTALVLRYYHGFDDAEIADALGCRPGTVRSLLSRGLATLRQSVNTDEGRTS